jgi:hypothetical protein
MLVANSAQPIRVRPMWSASIAMMPVAMTIAKVLGNRVENRWGSDGSGGGGGSGRVSWRDGAGRTQEESEASTTPATPATVISAQRREAKPSLDRGALRSRTHPLPVNKGQERLWGGLVAARAGDRAARLG